MFRSLADEKINILAISTSEIKISVLIREDLTQKAVKYYIKHLDLTNKLMSIRPFRDIKRKKTKKIKVGKVEVGGDAPISVQSMTNTLTTDVDATIKQINELTEAGADIVRVSCPDKDSSLSLKKIIKQVDVPIVADIHYHYSRAIEAAMSGAHCLRINPGNIGSKKRIREILKAAKDNNCSIRVGLMQDLLKSHY